MSQVLIILGLILTIITIGLMIRRRRPVPQAVAVTASAVPRRDNRLRNPRVLALLPYIEDVIRQANRPLNINEITRIMSGYCPFPFTRRDVRIGLPTLVTNHHTVVRHGTKRRSGRRGPHRYTAHSGLRASGPRTAASRPAAPPAA